MEVEIKNQVSFLVVLLIKHRFYCPFDGSTYVDGPILSHKEFILCHLHIKYNKFYILLNGLSNFTH